MEERVLNLIKSYYSILDSSIEKLSNKYEQHITGLPSWALCNRLIKVAEIKNKDYLIFKVIPSEEILSDVVISQEITNDEELRNFVQPWSIDLNIQNITKFGTFQIGDAQIIEEGNINALPQVLQKGILGFLAVSECSNEFSHEKAIKDALDIWNNAQNGLPGGGGSFIYKLKNIFDKFNSIIKRKAFKERRIHRFINENKRILLPEFKNCFFEYEFILNVEKRKADFILEKEAGLPAILIELESPHIKVFKKNGELTAEGNHAKNQIADWVKFIDENPDNSMGKMSFLKGRKERLVIGGRGLEFLDKMKDSLHSDTTIWTYTLLIKELKERWNNLIIEQCKLLGISNPNTLK